jgi:hypothetical protein
MSYSSLLNLTCNIQTKSAAFSGTGGPSQTFVNKATNIKCTIQPAGGGLVSAEYMEKLNVTHQAFFEIGADIVAGDKVVQNSIGYIVKHVFNAAGRAHHKEVLLELRE